jgi:hypothetical protein
VESKTTEEPAVDTGHMEEGTEESSEESWDTEEEAVVAGEQQQQSLIERTKEHLLNSQHNNSYIINSLNNNLSDINIPSSSDIEEEWIVTSFDIDRLISIRQKPSSIAITKQIDKRLIEIHGYYKSQYKRIANLFGRGKMQYRSKKNSRKRL